MADGASDGQRWSVRSLAEVVLAVAGGVLCAAELRSWGLPPALREQSRQRGELAARIRHLLTGADLRIVFQPIVSMETGRMVGAEALSRFGGPSFGVAPDIVFADAASVGLGVDLELTAVQAALRAANALPDDLYVSVNVSPAALLSSGVMGCLRRSELPLNRLVLEVTEHVLVPDYDLLAARAEEVRALGARIAVDDAGAGFASFRHILRLRPEFIKLDRTLIENISEDPARRALAAAVMLFALETGSTVVAEGVETVAELRTAQVLGIDAAQGFLLGRPTDNWTTWSEWHSHGPLYKLSAVA